MKRNFFEIYLTSDYVIKEDWLKLFYKISKVNGIFITWKLWINIENNYVRYFIETNRMLPPTLGDAGGFLIKKSDVNLKEKSTLKMPYILMPSLKNILDIYDNNETRKSRKLKNIKITFYPYKYNGFFSTTKLYFKTKENKTIRKKVFGNSKIYEFISIDFGTHTRFFYQKEVARYLEIKKAINLFNSDKEKALLEVDAFPYLQDNLYLKHNNYDFSKHSIVIGASGTGKSKMVSSLIKNLSNDSQNSFKYKIVVIDPHAAIEDDIGGIDGSNVIDFKTEEASINLFMNGTDDILSSTESIMSIFKNIISDRYNSRLERVLRYSVHLLLASRKFNLVNLRKLLTEIEYRNKLIREADEQIPINIIEFFRVDFNELKTKSYQEAIAPIVAFIDEMQLLPAFDKCEQMESIKDEIEKNFITILSLDQMTLGLNITKTIAGFAMQSILQLVQAHTFAEHIILVVDEVSVIETPIINRFLSEARKYNLSLILAGQYLEQISDNLQKAIFTNVVNYFIFRVSRMDANILENNIKMEVAVNNFHLNRIKILTELEDRECVVRVGKDGKLYSAFKGRTADFVSIPRKRKTVKSNSNIKTEQRNNKKKTFSIETQSSLKDIMARQSASRRKVSMENNG
jgi:GTPase SAR1 family protein